VRSRSNRARRSCSRGRDKRIGNARAPTYPQRQPNVSVDGITGNVKLAASIFAFFRHINCKTDGEWAPTDAGAFPADMRGALSTIGTKEANKEQSVFVNFRACEHPLR